MAGDAVVVGRNRVSNGALWSGRDAPASSAMSSTPSERERAGESSACGVWLPMSLARIGV